MEEHEKAQLQEMLNEQTRAIFGRLDRVETTLAPIAAIYNSTLGFSSIMRFIFKAIVIPLSVLIGIILTIKQLVIGHIFIK